MDVVDDEKVDVAEALPEALEVVPLERLDELVGELLTGEEADSFAGSAFAGTPADGVQEVRLAQTDGAVQEERVVRPPGIRRHGAGRGAGDPVARADDEVLERVVLVQAQRQIVRARIP